MDFTEGKQKFKKLSLKRKNFKFIQPEEVEKKNRIEI